MTRGEGKTPPRGDAGAAIYRDRSCAEGYDQDRFGGRFGAWLLRRETGDFLDLLGEVPGPILDAGAGTGKLTLALAREGRRTIAADFSEAMILVARRKAVASAAARFALCDLQSLGFRDRAFEAAVSSRVLMHLPDWRAGIAELCRVTRRRIVLDFPRSVSPAGLDAWWKRTVPAAARGVRRGYRTFTVRAVSEELARHGFVVRAIRHGFLLPLALHRACDRPHLSEKVETLAGVLGLARLLGSPVVVRAERRP